MNILRSKNDPIHKDAELTEFAAQILNDQAEWLDATMKKILPQNIYRLAYSHPDSPILARYFKEQQIKLHHVPDQLSIQVMVKGQIVARFTPRIQIQGMGQAQKLDSDQDGSWTVKE